MTIVNEQSGYPLQLVKDLDITDVKNLLSKSDLTVSYEQSTVNKALEIYNKSFKDPSKLTYDSINSIAKEEYASLKKQHAVITKTIGIVENSGLYHVMEQLEKGLKDAELDKLYQKACTIKPSFSSVVLSYIGFGDKYKSDSLDQQYSLVNKDVIEKSVGIDSIVTKLEKDVISKRAQSLKSLGALKESFNLYFTQLQILSSQHLLARMVTDNYEAYIDHLKTLNKDNPLIQKQIIEAEQHLNTLKNKEAMILKTITEIPLRVEEYSLMIGSIAAIVQEADTTLDAKFTSIRCSLNSLAMAIKAKQNLTGQQRVYDIERQLNFMNTKAVKDLATQTANLSSNNRYQEAVDMKEHIQNLISAREDIAQAKLKEKQQFQETTELMIENINTIKEHIVNNGD